MKVELIGTGAIYTKYNSACTLINDDLIVDMPNGTLKQLLKKNYKPEKIRTILITHMHGDHTADVPFFLIHIFNYMREDNEITIIGPKGIENKIIQIFDAYKFGDKKEIEATMKIKYIEMEQDDKIVEIQNYKIQATLVSHGDEKPAYGYVINDTLSYTGDTGMCNGVEKLVKNSKVTIADTSSIEGDYIHMGINNIKYLTEKYNKKIIATHLRDTTREQLNKEKNKNILVVEDGYQFNIE